MPAFRIPRAWFQLGIWLPCGPSTSQRCSLRSTLSQATVLGVDFWSLSGTRRVDTENSLAVLQDGWGTDTETPYAGPGSLSFCGSRGFGLLPVGCRPCCRTPGPILESVFLLGVCVDSNLSVAVRSWGRTTGTPLVSIAVFERYLIFVEPQLLGNGFPATWSHALSVSSWIAAFRPRAFFEYLICVPSERFVGPTGFLISPPIGRDPA